MWVDLYQLLQSGTNKMFASGYVTLETSFNTSARTVDLFKTNFTVPTNNAGLMVSFSSCLSRPLQKAATSYDLRQSRISIDRCQSPSESESDPLNSKRTWMAVLACTRVVQLVTSVSWTLFVQMLKKWINRQIVESELIRSRV